MITKPSGYDAAQTYTQQEKLLAGGYVLRIIKTQISDYSWGSVLIIGFDISEGEHEGFYSRNFRNQPDENRKWKGTIRLTIPTDQDEDDKALRRFKSNIQAIEASNEGYAWDWNEASLKGKEVGGLFRNKEFDYKGTHGFFTECSQLCSAERIRTGNFTIPKDRMLSSTSNSNASTAQEAPLPDFAEIDEEVPF